MLCHSTRSWRLPSLPVKLSSVATEKPVTGCPLVGRYRSSRSCPRCPIIVTLFNDILLTSGSAPLPGLRPHVKRLFITFQIRGYRSRLRAPSLSPLPCHAASLLTFRSTGTIPLHRSATTSTSSSKRRRPNSTSFSAFGATPRIAACSDNARPRSTRAFRRASPRCQRSLASELTWPSPLQKSQVISPVRHPRSPQAMRYPVFAPPHEGQTILTMTYLLLLFRPLPFLRQGALVRENPNLSFPLVLFTPH